MTSDNAIKCFLWLENLLLSMMIVFLCAQVHLVLSPILAILFAMRVEDKPNRFYPFVYSFTFVLFLLQIYVYIRDQTYVLAYIGLPLTIFGLMYMQREQLLGRKCK